MTKSERKRCGDDCEHRRRIPRRRFVGATGAVVAGLSLSGCLDDIEAGVELFEGGDDDSRDDDRRRRDDDRTDTGRSDDRTDDAGGADDPGLDDDPEDRGAVLESDFDSFVVETWTWMEDADGEGLEQTATTEWDLANDRASRTLEMRDLDETESNVVEYVMIEDTTYYNPDGEECFVYGFPMLDRNDVAGIQVPDAGEIEDSDTAEYQGYDVVDGATVELWYYDLSRTIEFLDGEMTVAVDANTGHVRSMEGWYTTGHRDSPITVEFERLQHSFDHAFHIEPPSHC